MGLRGPVGPGRRGAARAVPVSWVRHLDGEDLKRLEAPAANGEPRPAPQVDVSIRVEAPAAEHPVEVARHERGPGDGRTVVAADALDRLQDRPGRVVGRGCVALGLVSEALDIALVERASFPFEQRRRDAPERDQRALGVRARVTDEGMLEERVGRVP